MSINTSNNNSGSSISGGGNRVAGGNQGGGSQAGSGRGASIEGDVGRGSQVEGQAEVAGAEGEAQNPSYDETLKELKTLIEDFTKMMEAPAEEAAPPAAAAPPPGAPPPAAPKPEESDDMMRKILEMLMQLLGLGEDPTQELADLLENNPDFAQELEGALNGVGASEELMAGFGFDSPGSGGGFGANFGGRNQLTL